MLPRPTQDIPALAGVSSADNALAMLHAGAAHTVLAEPLYGDMNRHRFGSAAPSATGGRMKTPAAKRVDWKATNSATGSSGDNAASLSPLHEREEGKSGAVGANSDWSLLATYCAKPAAAVARSVARQRQSGYRIRSRRRLSSSLAVALPKTLTAMAGTCEPEEHNTILKVARTRRTIVDADYSENRRLAGDASGGKRKTVVCVEIPRLAELAWQFRVAQRDTFWRSAAGARTATTCRSSNCSGQ